MPRINVKRVLLVVTVLALAATLWSVLRPPLRRNAPQDVPLPIADLKKSETATIDDVPLSRSGLDLVTAPLETSQERDDAPPNAQAAQELGASMVESVLPLLNNPALTKGMSPQQARHMRDLRELIARLQGDLNGQTPLSDGERKELTRRFQKMLTEMMAMPAAKKTQAP